MGILQMGCQAVLGRAVLESKEGWVRRWLFFKVGVKCALLEKSG